MTRSEKPWRPRRLLLTLLDESDATLVCAQTVIMARALEAEVSGVLVEESALFELAALQICAEIGAVTGRFRHMDEEALIARAQRRAALFRRELEALQETLGRPVPPLRVLRGHRLDPLREAQAEDLIFYTGAPSRLEDRSDLADLLQAARHTSGLLLLPARSPRHGGPLIALYHSPRMAETLKPALARLAGDDVVEQHLVQDMSEALLLGSLLAEQRDARLLVVELAAGEINEEKERILRQSLRRLTCPLLLVNSHPQ